MYPKRTQTRFLILLLTLAGALAACSGAPNLGALTPVPDLPTVLPVPPGAAATPTTAAAGNTAPAPLLLTQGDSGKTLTMKVGQMLQLRLRDRRWSGPVVDQKILAIAPMNEMLMQGTYGWNYRAVAPGQTTLTTEGACIPGPSGIACMSIELYKVTITVTP